MQGRPTRHMPTVACSKCGTPMKPNPSNMCPNCVKAQIDITRGIAKVVNVIFCKFCERYHAPPSAWIKASPGSHELGKFLVGRLNLRSVTLTNVKFVWTEPHSRRLKLQLTVEKQIFQGHGVRQTFYVEFVVVPQMCSDCHKDETPHIWKACLQIRQKTAHRRIFFYLEQLLLKFDAHRQALGVKEIDHGIDFYFKERNHSEKLLHFIQGHLPVRFKKSKELVSADYNSNTYNYKYSLAVEIAPICKYDLCLLPPNRCHGKMGPLALCHRVSNLIHLVNPDNRATLQINATEFYKKPFPSILESSRLVKFYVLDIEYLEEQPPKCRFRMANLTLLRASDGKEMYTRTHIGTILKVNDCVQGYDLRNTVINNKLFDKLLQKNRGSVRDVIVVRKIYENTSRPFLLKKMVVEEIVNKNKNQVKQEQLDFQEFVHDVTYHHSDYRGVINVYAPPDVSKPQKKSMDVASDDTVDTQVQDIIQLTDLLDLTQNVSDPVDTSTSTSEDPSEPSDPSKVHNAIPLLYHSQSGKLPISKP